MEFKYLGRVYNNHLFPSMGALTSNRKRGDEYSSNTPDIRRSKRAKFYQSSMHYSSDKPIITSNTTVSRISRYPDTKPPLPREIHAPVKIQKFGSSKPSLSKEAEGSNCDMGNSLSFNYEYTKNKAFGTLRYFRKAKEAVAIENERNVSRREEVILSDDDSSVEEVEIIEIRKPGNVVVKLVEEQSFQPSTSSVLTDGDLRAYDTGKLLDSLSLERDSESSREAYRKLQENSNKRSDSKLKALNYEILLNERILESRHAVKKPAELEIPHEPFIPLSEEDKADVNRAFSNRNKFKVLVAHQNSGIDITGKVLQCLKPRQWLNDEVINVYLELLKERESREPKKFLKCHFFNTFFYIKLRNGGFKAVKRWTSIRNLGYYLIDCDRIFVPIHRQIHWCLAIINAKDQKFQYLDSLKGRDPEVLKSLASYYVEEVKDKSGKVIDVSSWDREFVDDLPEQENGFDCGMFMVKYADFYSRGLGLCFDQEHMPYFRLRTANEILRLRAD